MEVLHCGAERGNGLFATKVHKKGSVVHVLQGTELENPSRESIRVVIGNKVTHIVDNYGQFINHSFNPSCFIDENKIVALIDIQPKTEITFNYNDNEVNMASPFMCDGVHVTGKKQVKNR